MVKSYTSHRIQCFTWKIPVKTGVRRIILKSAGLCPEGLKRGFAFAGLCPTLGVDISPSPSPDRRVTPVDHCLGCCECVDTPRPLTLLRVTTHPASALSHTCKKNVTYRVPQKVVDLVICSICTTDESFTVTFYPHRAALNSLLVIRRRQ